MTPEDERNAARDRQRDLEIYAALAERLASGGRTYGAAILLGIGAGVLFALAGIILALLGISGAVDFVVQSTSVKARLTNASPGVVIAAMGMIIIWRYKPKLSHDVELRPPDFRSSGKLYAPADFLQEGLRNHTHGPTFRSRGSA